jgi:hypothetical protein
MGKDLFKGADATKPRPRGAKPICSSIELMVDFTIGLIPSKGILTAAFAAIVSKFYVADYCSAQSIDLR